MDRDRHIAIFLRMMAVNEIRLARRTFSLLKGQANDMAQAFAEAGYATAEGTLDDSVQDVTKLLVPTSLATITQFASYTADQLGKSKATFELVAEEFIRREGLTAAVEITETTREHLKKIVLFGQQEGLGQDVVARLIRKEMISFSRPRSRTIARTETHNSATFAQLETADAAGRPLVKEWVSVEDSRTRLAHSIADGQTKELRDDFLVDNEYLQRPGEGSAGNSINCRCTMIFIPPTVGDL